MTVGALTDAARVSQPAVSKHLGVLKLACLVKDRREGRQIHHSIDPKGLAPLADWMNLYAAF
jgi:DNA-binding transcriptional ArsR family regulator